MSSQTAAAAGALPPAGTPTPSGTAELNPTVSPTNVPAPAATLPPGAPLATFTVNARCRFGPSTAYETDTFFNGGIR